MGRGSQEERQRRPGTSRWIAETAERPGRLVTRVVITAVYLSINTSGFVGPNHLMRTVTAKHLELQASTRTLRAGDQVDIL